MAFNLDRAVFTVTRHELGWAVEYEGKVLDTSPVRDEVMACASRRARAMSERGSPAQIRIQGEPDFGRR